MSELFDKELNRQKESLKKILGSRKLPQTPACKPTKKCAMKMKETKKKQRARKNVIDGRKPFIRHTQRTGENKEEEVNEQKESLKKSSGVHISPQKGVR